MTTKTKKGPKNVCMVDWWVGTVFLTFFPILLSMIISYLVVGRINFDRIIGDGELILASFLIVVPSIINFFKGQKIEPKHKVYFYCLLFLSFFQIVTYTCIKINSSSKTDVVNIASGFSVISSIMISRQGEINLIKGENK